MEIHANYIIIEEREIPCRLVRSARRTLAVEIRRGSEGNPEIIIRAPQRMKQQDIWRFIGTKEKWITEKCRAVLVDKDEKEPVRIPDYMTDEWLRTEGVECFRRKIEEWSGKMGISHGRVTIRDQKTRWGSCSSKGNLNFSWRLLMMPEEIMDYVVVHELAHRREMNHSPRFWQIVGEYIPDYAVRKQWLRENGSRYTNAI